MAEALNNFMRHHLQNDFYCGNLFNQTFELSLFYLALLLIMLQALYLNQFFFTRLEILDLSTNPFSFIFFRSIPLIHLL